MNFYLRCLSVFTVTILLSQSFPLRMTGNTWVSSAVMAQTIGDRKDEVSRFFLTGTDFLEASQFKEALAAFEKALAIARKTGDRKIESLALMTIGKTYDDLRDYPKALNYYQQALSLAITINYKDIEGNILNNIGWVYLNLKQYNTALQYYQKAFTIAEKNADERYIGITRRGIGLVYYAQEEYSKALPIFNQALAIAKKTSDKEQEGVTIGNIAGIYLKQKQYIKALETYNQALAIYQEINDTKKTGDTFINIAEVYSLQEKYADALKFYQKALSISQQFKYQKIQADSVRNIGMIYNRIGQYHKTLDIYRQALEIYKKIGDKEGEGEIINIIGIAYNSLGKYSDAENSYKYSLKISQQTGDTVEESIRLQNLGSVYHFQNKFTEALNYYNQALELAKKLNNKGAESLILHNIGGIYLDNGNYAKALDYYQKSLQINDKIGIKEWKGFTLSNTGVAYIALAKYSQAEAVLFSALEVWESLRSSLKDDQKITIFERQSHSYRFLQRALVAQNQSNNALEIAERGRARAFVELLASKQLEKNQNKQNSKLNIQQIKQIAQQQRATIVQYSIIPNTFQFQEKQKLDYPLLYIWVVKPTGEITFKQVDLKSFNTSLQDLVINSRDSIGVRSQDMFDIKVINPQPEDPTEELKQLHKILIAPIANLLPKDPNEKVIFIPQESLFLVPFPALLDDEEKYLIEKHTILTAPSIQVLDLTRKQKENSLKIETSDRNTALVVGNPTMPKIKIGDLESNLKPLPGSQKEALKIAKFFNIEALTGSKATKSSIMQKMEQASIIHLATHGLLHDFKGFGVPGAIALAPSGNKNDSIDGLLTAGEILDMKLKADLVVLSACDTGRGTITGDGVIGLSRSLFSAGVPSVVVSLWAVDDDSTAFLMTEFYQNLLNKEKPLNKAQALRQAMLTTMKQKEYSNPLHWAAFTLIGEAD
ncbi:CHAT domain-containing protein [Plectonema radiosum]|nr:CHAT domain-containing tetratricopeptide repeat protein [Plectonema radiosum]